MTAGLDWYVQVAVRAAPELTDDQVSRLRELLRPYRAALKLGSRECRRVSPDEPCRRGVSD